MAPATPAPKASPPKTAIPAGPVTKSVQATLMLKKEEIEKLCSKYLSADQLFKIALNCIAKTPALLDCTASSLVQCIITFAEWGLHPNPATGYCYMVPYKQTASPMLGYRGMMELARRSGQVVDIQARVVREGETFTCRFGFNPELEHLPGWNAAGKVVGVYALATLKGGHHHVELMSRAEIEDVRGRSKSGQNGPWVTDWEEMAKKTAVRRMMKYLPMGPAEAEAMETDDDNVVEGQVSRQTTVAPPPPMRPALVEQTHRETLDFSAQPEREPVLLEREEAPVQNAQALPVDPSTTTPHDPVTGEVKEEPKGDDPDSWTERMIAKMHAAPDLNALMSLSREVKNGPADRGIELMAAYQKAKDALKAKAGGA